MRRLFITFGIMLSAIAVGMAKACRGTADAFIALAEALEVRAG